MIPRISVLMVITIMIYCYFHDIIITIIIIFIIIILISDDLSEDPKDGRLPASQIWNNDIINIYKYAHDSMKSSKYIINKIKLKWVRNFYNNIKRTLKSVQCDLLIYGNARDFNSDVLLIDTAKSLSIPVITELLNLFIDSELLPHVIIAPSTYAAEHDSISSVSQPINTLDQHPSHHHHPFTIIIPPSLRSLHCDRKWSVIGVTERASYSIRDQLVRSFHRLDRRSIASCAVWYRYHHQYLFESVVRDLLYS